MSDSQPRWEMIAGSLTFEEQRVLSGSVSYRWREMWPTVPALRDFILVLVVPRTVRRLRASGHNKTSSLQEAAKLFGLHPRRVESLMRRLPPNQRTG